MSLNNCKASNSDKDQWEKAGGFFLFPGYSEQCAIVNDFDTAQAVICVDILFEAYTPTCRTCMNDYQICIANLCTTECIDCTSVFNFECPTTPGSNCTKAPECNFPAEGLYDSQTCQDCIVNNCNQDFRSCSGYSAERCETCINPFATDDNDILLYAGAGGGALAFIALCAVVYYRFLKPYKRKPHVPQQLGYMAKLVGEDKKKKSKTGTQSQNMMSFSAPKPTTVPPGLGYTQPPRPVQPVMQPAKVKKDVAVDYPQFVVAFGFEAENVDELDAEIGTVVIGLSQVDENWWMCQDTNGRQGMIPTDFLREPEDEERLPASRFNDSLGEEQTAIFVSPSGQQMQQKVTVVRTEDLLKNGNNEESDDEDPEF